MLNKILDSQKGFTLIEMVIVIAVMGILMGIAFRGFGAIQQGARDTRRIANLRTVQTQLESYMARCGHYPTNTVTCRTPGTTGTALDSPNTATLSWPTLRTHLGATVVAERDVPIDPLSGHPQYIYQFSPGGLNYIIAANTERAGSNPDVTGMFGTLNCDTWYCVRN